MITKPRSDSFIETLPELVKAAVNNWLFVQNLSYKATQQRLLGEYGIKCGKSALATYYQRNQKARLTPAPGNVSKETQTPAELTAIADILVSNIKNTHSVLVALENYRYVVAARCMRHLVEIALLMKSPISEDSKLLGLQRILFGNTDPVSEQRWWKRFSAQRCKEKYKRGYKLQRSKREADIFFQVLEQTKQRANNENGNPQV